MKNFEEFGIAVPEILLPKNADISAWSVIACDQFTQDKSYWEKVSECAGNKPSTLNFILPEVYLSSPDCDERISKIRKNMTEALDGSVFAEPEKEFIYVERTTEYNRTRKGLVVAIDLETYEWKPFSKALIRATEATIVERIPPRKKIRNEAPLESPHIMLLVNDSEKKLVEETGERVKKNAPVYDGDLMLNSGHITGWAVKDEADFDFVHETLSSLAQKNKSPDGDVFMFAVGDGNHSLATAKAVWEEYKASHNVTESPVRYALVEIVNIYDSGLTFEPIHRVLFGTDSESVAKKVQSELGGTLCECESENELEDRVKKSSASFGFVNTVDGKKKYLLLETPVKELAVSRLQPVLDEFIKSENDSGKNISIDYIHGSAEVFRLGSEEGVVSILLPPIAKDSFFATIGNRGPLPRKSFSMGEASEKRFYLECRRLFS